MKNFICEVSKKKCAVLEKHHITSRCYGGSNHSSNIAWVSPTVHRLIHRGKIIIEGRFDGTSGNILVWRLENEPSVTEFPDPKVFLINDNSFWKPELVEKMIKGN
jgi:hypothetical protein